MTMNINFFLLQVHCNEDNKKRLTFHFLFFFEILFLNALGQHLLQDTYKMLPSQSVSGFSLPTANTAPPTPQAPSPRSQRRYSGRATCDCPNCQEAERLGKCLFISSPIFNVEQFHVVPNKYYLATQLTNICKVMSTKLIRTRFPTKLFIFTPK